VISYHILITPYVVYVKESSLFLSQGGNIEKWGKDWIKVQAASIEDARVAGTMLREEEKLCV